MQVYSDGRWKNPLLPPLLMVFFCSLIVQVMRKNLLKYVRVREFAPEAEFCDPCPSFILPNVICRYTREQQMSEYSRVLGKTLGRVANIGQVLSVGC